MVELSSKFGAAPGEAVDLIPSRRTKPVVEGLSFHVGSQSTNSKLRPGVLPRRGDFQEAKTRGFD